MTKKAHWSKVRKETDAGKTDDKVDYPDAAAAPLGTDEEAGGAGTPGEEIARSLERRKPRKQRRKDEEHGKDKDK